LFFDDLFKAAFNLPYLNYRHLSKNLYTPPPKYIAPAQGRSVFVKGNGPADKGKPNCGEAQRRENGLASSQLRMMRCASAFFTNNCKSGLKTSDRVREQGAGR
jgi:hypothetical protein